MLATSPSDITPANLPQIEYNWSTQNAAPSDGIEEIGKASWTSRGTTSFINGSITLDDANGD